MNIMSLLEKTKLILREHRIYPKKRLGQNFVIEPSIFQQMISYASPEQDDVVLDIGAGLGFLTSSLAEKTGRVLAVESDLGLVKILRKQLRNLANVEIIEGDVLKAKIPHFNKIVSTPPYQISSPLIQWLFDRNFDCAVMVFQKEFANRLVAPVGSEDYGWLTVITYYRADVELLDAVPKQMFYPQPEVDSIIARLKPKRQCPFTLKNEMLFKQLVQRLFTQRNRKLRNAITFFIKSTKNVTVAGKALDIADFLPFRDKRVRELAPEDFGVLANVFSN